jgi:hypothetical protein
MTAAIVLVYIFYFVLFYLPLIGLGVAAYILTGKSLSAIARRRGIEKPWLAWVPVGCDWLLGCISDQFRYVAYGQETNRRKKLLWYNIALLLVVAAVLTVAAVMVAMAAMGASEDAVIPLLLLMLVPYLAIFPLAVLYSINYFKSCYDLFRSCDPGKSLVYLLVSIFAGFPLPFFLYSCRNKDLGMPPRQEPPADTEAV